MPHCTQLDRERIATSTRESKPGVLVVSKHHLLVRCSHWLNVPILLGLRAAAATSRAGQDLIATLPPYQSFSVRVFSSISNRYTRYPGQSQILVNSRSVNPASLAHPFTFLRRAQTADPFPSNRPVPLGHQSAGVHITQFINAVRSSRQRRPLHWRG